MVHVVVQTFGPPSVKQQINKCALQQNFSNFYKQHLKLSTAAMHLQ